MKKQSLCTYASGSGALSFVWHDFNVKGREGQAIASGRSVTRRDAIRFLTKTKKGKWLLSNNWRVIKLNGQFYLAKNVKRIDQQHLEVDGEVYYYAISGWSRAFGNLYRFYFTHKGVERELHNESIKSQLEFFLRNESYL